MYTGAGHYIIDSTDFDLFEILAESIRHENVFEDRVRRAEQEVAQRLNRAIEHRNSLKRPVKLPAPLKMVVAFALVEADYGTLKVAARSIGRNESGLLSMSRQDPHEDGKSGAIPLGARKGLEDLSAEERLKILRLGRVEAARRIVNLEIENSEKSGSPCEVGVGPPVDVFTKVKRAKGRIDGPH